jgi:hypothetical protein
MEEYGRVERRQRTKLVWKRIVNGWRKMEMHKDRGEEECVRV